MKTLGKHIILLVFFALLVSSCQDEAVQIIEPSQEEVLVANSSLSNLMLRASANSVASDNVLDNSSCFSVELPVTIVISDTTITINSEDDLSELEDILEEFDDELPAFVFPITIVFSNYTELVIQNQDEFDDLLDQCFEDDDNIECVDFVYPISFSVLNTAFTVIDTITIEDSEELYEFLERLEDGDESLLVSLNFPVSLQFFNGETVTVNSNQELSDAIERAENICDDDTIIECSPEDIEAFLKECSWELDDEFDDLEITFNTDFSLEITGDDLQTAITGTWDVSITDNGTFLTLSELTGLQEDLQGAWLITECEDDEIEIVNSNGLELDLDRDCEEDINCDYFDVSENLQHCEWKGMSDILTGETPALMFTAEGEVKLSASATVIGVYTFSIAGADTFIDFAFETELQALTGQWKIEDCDDDELELTRGNDVLILEKDCDDDDAFDCFDDAEDYIELCDENNDGVEVFDITSVFADCTSGSAMVSYHLTEADADNNTNPIASPEAYTNTSAPQTIYARVDIEGEYEVFDIELKLEDCTANDCSLADVNSFLQNCVWVPESYNGDDNLDDFELDFGDNDEVIVLNTVTSTTVTGMWLTSETDGVVSVEFSGVALPDIQAINGSWEVVECQDDRIKLQNASVYIILEKDCD